MMVLVVAVMASLALTKDDAIVLGLPETVFGPIALVATIAGWVIFEGRNWRCPACQKSLGRGFNPRHCRGCGVELRG